MEDTIYNLFLTNGLGWSLYGTLRLRAVDAATSGGTTLPPLQAPAPALQPAQAELAQIPVSGELSVPLLSPLRAIAVRGVVYGTAAGLFSIAVDSGTSWPRAGIQLFPLSGNDYYGGLLIWGTSNFSESVFSVLARQLPRQG